MAAGSSTSPGNSVEIWDDRRSNVYREATRYSTAWLEEAEEHRAYDGVYADTRAAAADVLHDELHGGVFVAVGPTAPTPREWNYEMMNGQAIREQTSAIVLAGPDEQTLISNAKHVDDLTGKKKPIHTVQLEPSGVLAIIHTFFTELIARHTGKNIHSIDDLRHLQTDISPEQVLQMHNELRNITVRDIDCLQPSPPTSHSPENNDSFALREIVERHGPVQMVTMHRVLTQTCEAAIQTYITLIHAAQRNERQASKKPVGTASGIPLVLQNGRVREMLGHAYTLWRQSNTRILERVLPKLFEDHNDAVVAAATKTHVTYHGDSQDEDQVFPLLDLREEIPAALSSRGATLASQRDHRHSINLQDPSREVRFTFLTMRRKSNGTQSQPQVAA